MMLAPEVDRAAVFPAGLPPQAAVVVDTEEAFDWSAEFTRHDWRLPSIAELERAQAIFDRLGIVPTYVVGYPVATATEASSYLRGLSAQGTCEIGAHLHAWVTPPFEEELSARNSYQGNLTPALERRKLETLTRAIEDAFAIRPKIFKAGRYGIGADSLGALAALGYEIDCSVVPFTSFEGQSGPSFRGLPDRPYWTRSGILEIPLTRGFAGLMSGAGPALQRFFDSPSVLGSGLAGAISRLRLVERITLTPEGTSPAEQMRLVESLLAGGRRIFVVTYHSPSLGTGNTPYVTTEEEREALLANLEGVLTWLRDSIGVAFTTLSGIRRLASRS